MVHDLRGADEHRERPARRVDERTLSGTHDEAARRGAHLGERERARGRSTRRGGSDHQEQYERPQEARHRARVACSIPHLPGGAGSRDEPAPPRIAALRGERRQRRRRAGGGEGRSRRWTRTRRSFNGGRRSHRAHPSEGGSVAALRADGYPPQMVSTARVRAPELDGAGGFIGTAGPLTLASLRGRVVLLDFWTQACVNCLHVLEEIQRARAAVRRRPARRSAIHSPKFPHEHGPRGRRACGRAPRDPPPRPRRPRRRTWSAYAVQAWPTLVLSIPRATSHTRSRGRATRPTSRRRSPRCSRRTGQRARSYAARCRSSRARCRRVPASAFPGKVAHDPERGLTRGRRHGAQPDRARSTAPACCDDVIGSGEPHAPGRPVRRRRAARTAGRLVLARLALDRRHRQPPSAPRRPRRARAADRRRPAALSVGRRARTPTTSS